MADGTICIWTPQGLKCSASPVKSHHAGGQACGTDPEVRKKIKSAKENTDRDLSAYLTSAMDSDDWLADIDSSHPTGSDRKRARLIARVVELMYAADVKEGEPFTIASIPK